MGKRPRRRRSGPASEPSRQANEQNPSQQVEWWKRPIVWLMVVTITALAAYFGDVIRAALDSVAPPEKAASALLGQEPIRIVSLDHIYDNAMGAQGYVVKEDVDPTPVQPLRVSHEEAGRWAEKNDAVDLAITAWEVAIEGMRTNPVEITNIAPRLEEPCREALNRGIILRQSEGLSEKIFLYTDITAPNPTFDGGVIGEDGGATRKDGTKNFFAHKNIRLEKGETQVLTLQARALKWEHCRWRYRIEYLSDGEKQSMTLSAPDGEPFEVTGPHPGLLEENKIEYPWVVPSRAHRGGCNDKVLPKLTWREFEETWRAGPAGSPGCGG